MESAVTIKQARRINSSRAALEKLEREISWARSVSSRHVFSNVALYLYNFSA